MVARQEAVRFPDRREIRVRKIPGNILNRVEEVSHTMRIYYTADGKGRVTDAIVGRNNVRELILEVGGDGATWATVMRVREQRSPKGKKVQRQDLWISGISINGVLRQYYVEDDGTLSDADMNTFYNDQETRYLTRLGVYVKSSLPPRIDRAATMQNFLNVVRSGRVMRPEIVALH